MKTKSKIIAVLLVFLGTILISQHCWPQQQSSPQRKLGFSSAMMAGDESRVAELIQGNTNLVDKDPFTGQPSLVAAAEWGQLKIVELLVTNNADVNARGVWGFTALHFAVTRGDVQMVNFLVEHKANVNIGDDQGCAPIVHAYRNVEIIKSLLAHGADINAHCYDNTLYSQTIGNLRDADAGVVEFLLTNGADLTISANEGLPQAVAFSGNTNLVKMLVPYYAHSTNPSAMPLLQGALELAIDNDRKAMASAILDACVQLQTNSLHKAVALGDDAAVRSILAANSSAVNEKDFFGWTPLHLAAMAGKTQIAEMLISSNATLDVQDDISNTPLLWAAYFGHADMVALLLRHKANTDIQGDTVFNSGNFGGNDTPLDLAIEQGFTPIAAMLITNGAALGSHKYYSDTPLHLATSKENVELMKLLIAHGANVNARSQASWTMPLTCLDIAVKGNSPEAVSLLIANGASIQTQQRTHSWTNTTLFHLWAEGSGNTNIADQLLAAGCDPNAKNGDGQTPLHVAVGSNEKSLWLLNRKVDVNAKDKNGQTPLHLVVTSGNTNAIRLLLDFKADINTTDSKGKTPLALLEDLKINQFRSGRGMRMIDFKAVENLLLKNGATGPVLTPDPKTAPQVIN